MTKRKKNVFLDKKNNSSYKASNDMLEEYSDKLKVSKNILSSIIFDSNIIFTEESIFMNRVKISKLEFIDYVIDCRSFY